MIDHVLNGLREGRALYRILAEDENLVSRATFMRWHDSDQELRDNVARAREHGATYHVDDALEIAATRMEVKRRKVNKDGSVEEWEEDDIAHRRLLVETKFKAAAMIAPRKYGNKLDLTSQGEKIETAAPALHDNRVQSLLLVAQQRKQGLLPKPDEPDIDELFS